MCWYSGSYGLIYRLSFFIWSSNFCAWVFILKFCHLKIVNGAVDDRKWSAIWRNWNISDISLSSIEGQNQRRRPETFTPYKRTMQGGLVAQAVTRSPPTAGGPEFASRSLHVGFVVDETGSGLVFRGVSPVFPYLKFHSISPYSSHPFRFISSALVMVRQAWSAGTLAIHWPTISGLHRISSLDATLCWTRVEDISFIYRVSQKHRQRLVCCAGQQTDYFSRRNPCPEPHGLGAVEHRSVRSTCRQ